MKKLSLLLIAIFFSLLSVGNAMAEEPQRSILDRNAVWTNKSGATSDSGKSGYVSVKNVKPGHMNGKPMKFDFIKETRSYDHAKDGRQSV